MKQLSLITQIKKSWLTFRLNSLIPVALLGGFVLLTVLVFKNKTNDLDNRLANLLTSWRFARNFFRLVVDNRFILFLAGFSVLFFVLKKQFFMAALEIVAALGGLLLSSFLKDVFQRTGPSGIVTDEGNYSYPSGHATVTIALIGVLLIFGARDIKWVWLKQLFIFALALLIVSIGSGMVYLRNHFVTDILGGWLIGGCYLSILLLGYDFLAGYLKTRLKASRQP